MGKLPGCYIFPHPPIIVPEIGRGDAKGASATVAAVRKASEEIGRLKPSTIVVITPHGPVFQDALCVSVIDRLSGSFKKFGKPNISFEFDNNRRLADSIIGHSRDAGITIGELGREFANAYGISIEVDHGALVPLYFVKEKLADFKLVHITMGFLPFEELYLFGTCIAKAITETDEDIVVIGSGDLSHRLTREAPSGFNERGREFDLRLVQHIREGDAESMVSMDEGLIECAGECGLRPFIILFGVMDGYDIRPEVLSYEGPFGVGYCVARFETGSRNESRNFANKLFENRRKAVENIRTGEDPHVALARMAAETYVREGRIIRVPAGLPQEMQDNKAGAFVSIKKQGQLRGCIGTTGPTGKNIAEEIINNAISSVSGDPRFNPVEPHELDKLVYSVDILGEAEPINSMTELDPVRYGVIVRSGRRSGLLLPNLEGVDTVGQQVEIALQKAGIGKDEKYTMERFEVVRYK